MKVSDLGERALIARIGERLGATAVPGETLGETWSGDDAAVIESSGARLLFTTDSLIEGVDFDFSYCTGADVGWKAVAANVSDIAAMGGRPTRAVATLALRPDTDVDVVDSIAAGLAEAAQRWGLHVVGGDVSRASEMSLGLALLGVPGPSGPVLRSTAQPGDELCVTGELGGAAGGLRVLRQGMAGTEAFAWLVGRQLRPTARLEEGMRLAEAGVSAMIDVSDGLVADLAQLLDASERGCVVDPSSIPIAADLAQLEDVEPLTLALTGGEDFELLCAIPSERVERASDALAGLGTRITRIGRVTDDGRYIGDKDLDDWSDLTWEHLRGR